MQISLTTLVLATFVLERTLAQPAHRHSHHHKRSLREVLSKRWGEPPTGWDDGNIYKDVDWSKVNYNGGGNGETKGGAGTPSSASPAPTASTDSPAPGVENKMAVQPAAEASGQSSPKPSSQGGNAGGGGKGGDKKGGDGSCSNLADVWETGDTTSQGPTAATARKNKRATLEQDTYVGNTGDQKYGSNMKPESNCETGATYSLKFTNNMGSDEDFWLWNKIGADGQMNGMMKNAHYKFHLANGQSAVFSVESNTQTAFSHACGRAAGNGNVPNCNVGEANFDDQMSKGGSAYDVSMVTYNDIKKAGGSPRLVPMTISADGYDESTASNCVYTESSQNAPVQAGSSGKCAMGPIDASPFHVNVVYG